MILLSATCVCISIAHGQFLWFLFCFRSLFWIRLLYLIPLFRYSNTEVDILLLAMTMYCELKTGNSPLFLRELFRCFSVEKIAFAEKNFEKKLIFNLMLCQVPISTAAVYFVRLHKWHQPKIWIIQRQNAFSLSKYKMLVNFQF